MSAKTKKAASLSTQEPKRVRVASSALELDAATLKKARMSLLEGLEEFRAHTYWCCRGQMKQELMTLMAGKNDGVDVTKPCLMDLYRAKVLYDDVTHNGGTNIVRNGQQEEFNALFSNIKDVSIDEYVELEAKAYVDLSLEQLEKIFDFEMDLEENMSLIIHWAWEERNRA